MTWERKEILHGQYRPETSEKERKTKEKGVLLIEKLPEYALRMFASVFFAPKGFVEFALLGGKFFGNSDPESNYEVAFSAVR